MTARRISALVVVLALVLGAVPVFGASGTDIVRGILGTLINEAAKYSQNKLPQKSNTITSLKTTGLGLRCNKAKGLVLVLAPQL